MKKNLKKHRLLILISLLGFILRMYRVNYQILDWHSWRQADTASVTREYIKTTINPLYPKYHDLSSIPSGKYNPEGYRMVEFPIYNMIVAAIIKTIPALPLEATSRVVSTVFSIGTLLSIFFLTKIYFGKKTGYLASFFFAVIPYSIYYSRVVLPEPIMVFFSTFSLTTFIYFLKKKNNYFYLLSLISLALAFLLKPFVIFLLPVYITMLLEENGLKKTITDFKIYIFGLLSIIPFLLWRKWIGNFPEGIPASDWLFNSDGIRLRPAWFRWLGYERLTKLILGYFGIIFLPISFLNQLKNKKFLIPSWWFGILLYFIVLATGNVKHDYYQAIIMPIVSITLAHGLLIAKKFLTKKTNNSISITITSVLIFLMLFFAYKQVKGYFNINHHEYYKAGVAADKLLPEDALVIAPQYGGDTAYLFQTNRKGWPIGFEIEDKIEKGAQYYISTTYDDEARDLEKTYTLIEKTEDYIIIDLTKKRIIEE